MPCRFRKDHLQRWGHRCAVYGIMRALFVGCRFASQQTGRTGHALRPKGGGAVVPRRGLAGLLARIRTCVRRRVADLVLAPQHAAVLQLSTWGRQGGQGGRRGVGDHVSRGAMTGVLQRRSFPTPALPTSYPA